MDLEEALTMALKKEKSAVEMYRKLSFKYPTWRDLFDFLMNEEEKHVALIKKKISEIYK